MVSSTQRIIHTRKTTRNNSASWQYFSLWWLGMQWNVNTQMLVNFGQLNIIQSPSHDQNRVFNLQHTRCRVVAQALNSEEAQITGFMLASRAEVMQCGLAKDFGCHSGVANLFHSPKTITNHSSQPVLNLYLGAPQVMMTPMASSFLALCASRWCGLSVTSHFLPPLLCNSVQPVSQQCNIVRFQNNLSLKLRNKQRVNHPKLHESAT